MTKTVTWYDEVPEYDYSDVHRWTREFERAGRYVEETSAVVGHLDSFAREHRAAETNLELLRSRLSSAQRRRVSAEEDVQRRQQELRDAHLSERRHLVKRNASRELGKVLESVTGALPGQLAGLVASLGANFSAHLKRETAAWSRHLQAEVEQKRAEMERHDLTVRRYRDSLGTVAFVISTLDIDHERLDAGAGQ